MNFLEKLFGVPVAKGAPKPPFATPVPPTQQPYAIERIGNDSAEIMLYGEVVSERPVHWWTGEPLDGQYIVLSEFMEDLKQVENVANLTVRIHSLGGSIYDAMTIHNRLKALKAHVTVIVDGVAMSAGADIMCAGDTVRVFPGSLVMIHRCWGYAVGNAEDLRKIADGYDAADRSQAAIFRAKTGLDTEELLAMMADPDFYVNEDASSDAIAEHAKLKQRLAAAEEEWFTLTEELEGEMARQQEQA
mgnify:CR=1 FL=1